MRESQTVLIVDDNHDIVRGAEVRLRAAGYNTLTANNGEQCIDTANDRVPDAILLDVRMPGASGLEVLDQLQQGEKTSNIPVVMLSASLVDQQAALEAGAKFFLSKPYQGRQLVETMHAVLDSPHLSKLEVN